MSTEIAVGKEAAPIEAPLSIRELIALLIKHYDLKEGKYDLMIEYKFGAGVVGQDKANVLPGIMIGLSQVGLSRASGDGPLTVDAKDVKLASKTRKKSP